MSLNPFEADVAVPVDPGAGGAEEAMATAAQPSWDDVARRLLDKNLILTALELHTELSEGGRELKRLRDFFSNPAHFELPNRLMPDPRLRSARSNSVTTLESLDCRLSDDGMDGVDRVAVLEFELRKAKDAITSLRDQLTVSSNPTEPSSAAARESESGLEGRPHEIRALCFLVNEFLLRHAFRITAVTFAEELPDQNFDDWDEVGLNWPRPGDLLSLFRDKAQAPPPPSADAATQTPEDSEIGELRAQNAVLAKRVAELEAMASAPPAPTSVVPTSVPMPTALPRTHTLSDRKDSLLSTEPKVLIDVVQKLLSPLPDEEPSSLLQLPNGAAEWKLAAREESAAMAVSRDVAWTIALTAKASWDLTKNYSSSLRDSLMLDTIGLRQAALGLLVDVECGSGGEMHVETLLGTVIEEGLLGLCDARSRIWLLRTKRGAKLNSAWLKLFRCDELAGDGMTVVSARLSAFLRGVCEGEADNADQYRAEDGALTLLNSLPDGARLFAFTDADVGLLNDPNIFQPLQLLTKARRFRLDIFMTGNLAVAAHLPNSVDEPAGRFFAAAKDSGGLYIPLGAEQPLSLELLRMVGETLHDRHVLYDGVLKGSLQFAAERDSRTELLLHCQSPTRLRLNDAEKTVQFLRSRQLDGFSLALVDGERDTACYLQVFHSGRGEPSPVLALSDDDGAPILGRSLGGKRIRLRLIWPDVASDCRLSWAGDEGSVIPAQEDCHLYFLDSLPSKPTFLIATASLPNQPVPVRRLLPRRFSGGSEGLPAMLILRSEKDAPQLELDPVLGFTFGRTSGPLRIDASLEEKDSSLLLVSACRDNDSYPITATGAPEDGPRILRLPLRDCSHPGIALQTCFQKRSGSQEWFRCAYGTLTNPLSPPAAVPTIASNGLDGNQGPKRICDLGLGRQADCNVRRWYLDLEASAIGKVQYATWPVNASMSLVDAVLRPALGRLKLEGSCCLRNLSLFGLSERAGLAAVFSIDVDPNFNAFPTPDGWTLWKILFAVFAFLLGVILCLLLVCCVIAAWGRRRRRRATLHKRGSLRLTAEPPGRRDLGATSPPKGAAFTPMSGEPRRHNYLDTRI